MRHAVQPFGIPGNVTIWYNGIERGGGVRRSGGGRGARIKAGPKSGDVCLL